jgi:hypothetical protein
MGDSLILGQIIATSAGLLRTQAGSGGSAEQQALLAELVRGQVLAARVIELLAGGRALIDLAGERLVAEGAVQLRPGQAITVRVSELSPQLQLEVLAERTAAEQNLASALRSLFSGADTATAARQLAQLVTEQLQSPELPVPERILSELARMLTSVQVEPDASGLAGELQTLVKALGLGLEAALKDVAAGEAQSPPAGEGEGLKALLGRLIEVLGPPVPREAALAEIRTLIQALLVRWSPAAGERAGELERLAEDVKQIFESALRSGAGKPPEEAAEGRLGRLLDFAKGLPQRDAAPFRAEVEELFQQLTRKLVTESAREQLGKSAGELHDRLENLQLLNVHLRDRGLYQHLLFPVSILGEMTEVQIKQYLAKAAKGKASRSLTAVLLLDLESLGRIRIDALLQDKAVYVNIFAERVEVAVLAASLEQEFADQLATRGFRLARLNAVADVRRVDDFHRFDAEILAGGDSLVDLQV